MKVASGSGFSFYLGISDPGDLRMRGAVETPVSPPDDLPRAASLLPEPSDSTCRRTARKSFTAPSSGRPSRNSVGAANEHLFLTLNNSRFASGAIRTLLNSRDAVRKTSFFTVRSGR